MRSKLLTNFRGLSARKSNLIAQNDRDSLYYNKIATEMTPKTSPRKVVVRRRDGQVVPGFAQEEELEKDRLRITTQEGKEQEFDIEELKAVFFVKDFRGNPEYKEVKFLDKQKATPMIWVQVEFFDGEVLEGKIPNSKELLFSQGFYLWPSDPDSNNQCVYIPKSAVTNFTILSPL